MPGGGKRVLPQVAAGDVDNDGLNDLVIQTDTSIHLFRKTGIAPVSTETKNRKSRGSRRRFIGKPTGLIQERVQAVGPEHFGIVAVDCAKRRSKWLLCNFYGKVIVEPTAVEHTTGGLRTMTHRVAEVCQTEGLTDTIVALSPQPLP